MSFATLSTKYLSNVSATADYSGNPIDTFGYSNGHLCIRWSGYNGSNGAVNVLMNNNKNAPIADWAPWGEAEGAFSGINSESDIVHWSFKQFGARYIRLAWWHGDATNPVTLNAEYVLRV